MNYFFIFVLRTLQMHPILPWESLCWATVPVACQSQCAASSNHHSPTPCPDQEMCFQSDWNQPVAVLRLIFHSLLWKASSVFKQPCPKALLYPRLLSCVCPHLSYFLLKEQLFQARAYRKPIAAYLLSWLSIPRFSTVFLKIKLVPNIAIFAV